MDEHIDYGQRLTIEYKQTENSTNANMEIITAEDALTTLAQLNISMISRSTSTYDLGPEEED